MHKDLIKDAYNSEASIKTYSKEAKLFDVEEKIFSFFQFSKDVKILDLGCGGGRTTVSLLKKGFSNILGVDIAENLIRSAQEKYPEDAHHFISGDVANLSMLEDGSFDIAFFSYNGIDYLPTREQRFLAYQEIVRLLTDGGLFIFSSHNRFCLPVNRNILKTLLANILNLKEEYWITKQSFGDIPTYYSSEKSLIQDLKSVGLEHVMTVPKNTFLFPLLDTFPYYVFKKI